MAVATVGVGVTAVVGVGVTAAGVVADMVAVGPGMEGAEAGTAAGEGALAVVAWARPVVAVAASVAVSAILFWDVFRVAVCVDVLVYFFARVPAVVLCIASFFVLCVRMFCLRVYVLRGYFVLFCASTRFVFVCFCVLWLFLSLVMIGVVWLFFAFRRVWWLGVD